VRRLLLLTMLAAVLVLGWNADLRRLLSLRAYALVVGFPELGEAGDEADARWFDDYYTIHRIDDRTFAIGEPRLHSQNYNYLILGDERALLFDSGPGLRDIKPVVASLTKLPVTAVPSHLHYDHIGNHARFRHIAIVDLPYLRARAASGVLRPTAAEHLGFVEGIMRPWLHVTQWLAPGSSIDLGGRELEILYTPGHTRDSISLYDADAKQLFTGDYVTEGPLYAFVPGSSLGDYLRTADMLIDRLDADVRLFTAHRFDPPGLPQLAYADLLDLRTALRAIKADELDGNGFFPHEYPINDHLWLATDFPWSQRWD
jgi:glyoxylase-like metal-dependent hydrolase (beta-lactamase superfamily II)